MAKVKKTLQLFSAMDLYRAIGKDCNIPFETVRDVFQSYFKILIYLFHKGYKVTLPNIGQFVPDYKAGKKAGDRYVGWEKVYDENGNVVTKGDSNRVEMIHKEKIYETDQPSYNKLSLVINKKLQEQIRELTSELKNRE